MNGNSVRENALVWARAIGAAALFYALFLFAFAL